MKLPLDYVPDEHFQAWIRNEKTEKEVLEPMPACGGSPAKAEPPSGISPYMAGLYEVPLLNREQEAHLFRRMNYLKYKASVFRGRLDPVRPRESQMAQIEKLYQEILATRNQIICANLRLVTSIAKRYQGLGRDIFELISDGNVSLMPRWSGSTTRRETGSARMPVGRLSTTSPRHPQKSPPADSFSYRRH